MSVFIHTQNPHSKHLSSNHHHLSLFGLWHASSWLCLTHQSTLSHIPKMTPYSTLMRLTTMAYHLCVPARPPPNQHASIEPLVNVDYYLQRANKKPNILAGSAVTHLDGLCPVCHPTDNPNLFAHLLGIEFMHGRPYLCQGNLPIQNCFLPTSFG